MKNSNYVNIQGWMVKDLDLSGNSLIVFALIYGFSQDGESEFKGSINYIKGWLNCSRSTVIRTLDDLVSKDLLIKEQVTRNNVTFNNYKANLTSAGTFEGGSIKMTPPVSKWDGGSIKMTPHNNIYNTNKEREGGETEKTESHSEYSPEQFLKRWADARKHYDKKPTHIVRLSINQLSIFKNLQKDYAAADFDVAIKGLFEQKGYPYNRMNPSHFLENFEQYLTCGKTGEKLFEDKKDKKSKAGML